MEEEEVAEEVDEVSLRSLALPSFVVIFVV